MADINYQLYVTTQNGRQEFAVAPATNIPNGYQVASPQDVAAEAVRRLAQYQQTLNNPGGTNTRFLSTISQYANWDPNNLNPDQIAALTGVQPTELAKVGMSSGIVNGQITPTNSSGFYSSQEAADYAASHPQSLNQGTSGLEVPPNPLAGQDASPGQNGPSGQVYRDQNDNFFYNGQQITLDQFHQLGINADFVPRGSTVSLGTATGSPVSSSGATGGIDLTNLPPEFRTLYDQLDQYLKKLEANGQAINPNVQITPDKLAEFTAQASKEIDPYYASQLKVAKDQFLGSLGYSADQILNQEKQLEQQYGTQLRNIGENAAESGFAQSGRRQLDEQQLAQNTQNTIDTNRRQLAYNTTQGAGSFAQQFGTANLPGFNLISAPRVLAGESSFGQNSQSSPFYTLSPEVYNGLTGSQQYQENADIRNRASQLEDAYRSQLATNQQRTLTV